MQKTNVKIKGGIEVVSVMVTTGIILALTAVLLMVLTFTLKPESVIKDDIAATNEWFQSIDSQMSLKDQTLYMMTQPTGPAHVALITTQSVVATFKDKNFKEISNDTIKYYDEINQETDPRYSVTYAINFSESKVDNFYLIRKINNESLFSYNAHDVLSNIIFKLNKSSSTRPAAILRGELTPIKMTNGEAYHYFAKADNLNVPVAFEVCKDNLECLYISRYHSIVPRPL